MFKVFNKDTGEFIGRISKLEMNYLADQLEEESIHDNDYYIRAETLDQFASDGAPSHLMDVLRGGIRNDNAIEIRWEPDKSSGS